jgi:hypothetical protein
VFIDRHNLIVIRDIGEKKRMYVGSDVEHVVASMKGRNVELKDSLAD